MSRFFTKRYSSLVPYVPGEQPNDASYIKLNTNESPYPPSPGVIAAASEEAGKLRLYSDPECAELRGKLSSLYGIKPEQLLMTNGSDEILNFAFMAFGDEDHPLIFPDITYGFYTVYADLNRIPYAEIPLTDDFTIDPNDYIGAGKNIVIANPNAPTGISLPLNVIEEIIKSNPDNVIIIDEAYVDFGGESAAFLIDKYDNLLVTQTFSKSRSMAGARLGFGIGNEKLIADLNAIKYSTNPYNINRMTASAGAAAIEENDYYMENCRKIAETRDLTARKLREMGFKLTDSSANFLFAESDRIDGGALYRELKKRGILVRHFDNERIKNYNRITVGTPEQMDSLIRAVDEILKELS